MKLAIIFTLCIAPFTRDERMWQRIGAASSGFVSAKSITGICIHSYMLSLAWPLRLSNDLSEGTVLPE